MFETLTRDTHNTNIFVLRPVFRVELTMEGPSKETPLDMRVFLIQGSGAVDMQPTDCTCNA